MEVYLPLSRFFNAIEDDAKINTTHISLYMALLQQWNLNGGESPFEITRHVVMRAAKINSRHTYNLCMRFLHEAGYINYFPSTNSCRQSRVYIRLLNGKSQE